MGHTKQILYTLNDGIMKVKVFSILIFFILINNYFLLAQDTSNVKTSIKNPEGREFWLCFLKNFKDDDRKLSKSNELQLEFFITSDKDANVIIEIQSINYRNSLFVAAGTIKNVKIDIRAQVRSFDKIEVGQGIHITADNPITVYGLNRRYQTTDTYLGLPVEVLGTEYRVMSYYVTDDLLSIAAIVATENNTIVEITPSVQTYSGQKAGETFRVTLNRGDVYQVAGTRTAKSDLTGTLIRANKKIAVFGGHQCSYVPSVLPEIIACNHLAEQLPPISSWGKHYYIGKFKFRTKYTYRVLAHFPETKVFENTNLVTVLKSGQYLERTTDQDIQITADKPVLVAQYSQGFKNGDSIGDPMMLLISPTQQFLRKYRFATPVSGEWEHIINIVVPTEAAKTIQLNGKPIDSTEFKPFGLSRYSIAYISIPYGSHVIEGALPFGMYSYGFGKGMDAFDAYGTMGGQSFMEYEYERDINPPTVEARYISNKFVLLIRDDKPDDTGIKDLKIISNNNIDFSEPNIVEATPQLNIEINPKVTSEEGRLSFRVRDVALNEAIFTVCYVYDYYEGVFKFSLNSGLDVNCAIDYGLNFGFFIKPSFVMNKVNFINSGNIKAKGKFENSNSNTFSFGLFASKSINPDWHISSYITYENYVGKISAPDTNFAYVRDITTGELKLFREQTNLELRGNYLQAIFAVNYIINELIYTRIGISFDLNLSKEVNLTREILEPIDFVYSNDKREIRPNDAPKELNSLRSFVFGLDFGFGLNFRIYKRIYSFSEINYNFHIMDLIDDGTWKYNKISLIIGVKYKL
jgi:hypothetical protein